MKNSKGIVFANRAHGSMTVDVPNINLFETVLEDMNTEARKTLSSKDNHVYMTYTRDGYVRIECKFPKGLEDSTFAELKEWLTQWRDALWPTPQKQPKRPTLVSVPTKKD